MVFPHHPSGDISSPSAILKMESVLLLVFSNYGRWIKAYACALSVI